MAITIYLIWYAQAVKDPYAEPYMHQAREVYPTVESQKLSKSNGIQESTV